MTHIVIHEVGPRDGLQMERQVVPIETREDWIRRVMESGVDIVQVGSFVHPVKVPQMADTDELIRRLVSDKSSPVILAGLALNERGLERGLECGVEMFCLGASASETHSLKNTGMATMEATRRIIGAAQQAVAAGKKVQVSVQSAFGCGFEGPIPEERVLGMVGAYLEAACSTSAWPTRPATPTRPRSSGCSQRCSTSTPTSNAPATSTTPMDSAWRISLPACASA